MDTLICSNQFHIVRGHVRDPAPLAARVTLVQLHRCEDDPYFQRFV